MQCSDTLQIIAAIGAIINFCGCSVVSGGSGAHVDTFTERNERTYYSDSVYRNLDSQLLRIGSRLDQLMIRMDHLDSRVGRVQSTGHLRFDSIETSMQTTRQRLDLWSNQLNLIEEQLSRKWKNMESRFDSLVSTLDSKLDTKFNLIQRDNRRHNEYISQAFNNVIISQEKMSDRIGSSINELNTTVQSTQSAMNDTRSTSRTHSSVCLARLDTFLKNLTTPTHRNTIQPTDQLTYSRPYTNYAPLHPQLPNQNSTTLISAKVSNMFDELVKRSHDLEAIVKDTFTMSNLTRREIQDGFMALIPIVSQVGFGIEKSGDSGEVMSMVVEALSTVEQTSTSLVRKMTELKMAIEERFEMVSMSLNGFLESCLRIQEKTPQLEDRITDVLMRILDSVDSSTRNATETWTRVKQDLQTQTHVQPNCTQNLTNHHNHSSHSQPEPQTEHNVNETALDYLLRAYENLQDNDYLPGQPAPHHHTRHHHEDIPEEEPNGRPSQSERSTLSEDQKKMIWESLSRLAGEERVPE